eukprot:scaffold25.g5090.t1
MLATCAEQRSGAEASTSAPRPARVPLPGMRKCASTPALCGVAEGEGLEVYVATRPFQEFAGGLFRKLPKPLRYGVRDAGICHFFTVFRARDGTLHQFDFGPQGGDIHVGHGPFAALGLAKSGGPAGARGRAGPAPRTVTGEVRERRLAALPANHMYVGTTRLSLADVRAFNSLHHARRYELHVNDCRHFVNSLVKYSTGFDAAASRMLVHQWQRNRSKYRLAERVVRLGHLITDVANWSAVKAIGHASVAAVLALSSHHTLTRFRGAAPAPARARLAPAGARVLGPVRQALARKPVVTVGTAAVATYAASGGPALRETASVGARIAQGVRTAVVAAATLAHSAGQCAVATTAAATNQVAAVASGAARGAARLVARQQPLAAAAGRAPALARHGSPMRITLPAMQDRAQRLALAITSAAARR